MQDAILDRISKQYEKKRPPFAVGDKVSVSVRLKEGEKERIQIFRGVVILKHPKSGEGSNATFTVRKISEGIGVERVFPVHSPFIEKIVVEASSDVRQSRLFYLRDLRGKKARLKDSKRFGDLVVPTVETAATPAVTEGAAAAPAEPKAEAKAEAKDKKKK